MSRLSGPSKAASNLSEPVQEYLNMYALAAGIAGLGMLALAEPVEAKIVYTTANVTIGKYGLHSYHLDFNHDGITELTIQWSEKNVRCFTGSGLSQRIDETPALRNLVEGPPQQSSVSEPILAAVIDSTGAKDV